MQTENKTYWGLRMSHQAETTHESRQLFNDERGPVIFETKQKAEQYLRTFEKLNLIRPQCEHDMRLIKINVSLVALSAIEEQTIPTGDPQVYVYQEFI
jgi:hypothetical protein